MNTVPTEEIMDKIQTEEQNVHLIKWEEFALSLEEHFHAQALYTKNPNSKPLGHR
jgi:hypothetical protein|tara:strand:+ start:211 stop:375 length:165 start_codon:yes stop_codon:yes gene_type:complete